MSSHQAGPTSAWYSPLGFSQRIAGGLFGAAQDRATQTAAEVVHPTAPASLARVVHFALDTNFRTPAGPLTVPDRATRQLATRNLEFSGPSQPPPFPAVVFGKAARRNLKRKASVFEGDLRVDGRDGVIHLALEPPRSQAQYQAQGFRRPLRWIVAFTHRIFGIDDANTNGAAQGYRLVETRKSASDGFLRVKRFKAAPCAATKDTGDLYQDYTVAWRSSPYEVIGEANLRGIGDFLLNIRNATASAILRHYQPDSFFTADRNLRPCCDEPLVCDEILSIAIHNYMLDRHQRNCRRTWTHAIEEWKESLELVIRHAARIYNPDGLEQLKTEGVHPLEPTDLGGDHEAELDAAEEFLKSLADQLDGVFGHAGVQLNFSEGLVRQVAADFASLRTGEPVSGYIIIEKNDKNRVGAPSGPPSPNPTARALQVGYIAARDSTPHSCANHIGWQTGRRPRSILKRHRPRTVIVTASTDCHTPFGSLSSVPGSDSNWPGSFRVPDTHRTSGGTPRTFNGSPTPSIATALGDNFNRRGHFRVPSTSSTGSSSDDPGEDKIGVAPKGNFESLYSPAPVSPSCSGSHPPTPSALSQSNPPGPPGFTTISKPTSPSAQNHNPTFRPTFTPAFRRNHLDNHNYHRNTPMPGALFSKAATGPSAMAENMPPRVRPDTPKTTPYTVTSVLNPSAFSCVGSFPAEPEPMDVDAAHSVQDRGPSRTSDTNHTNHPNHATSASVLDREEYREDNDEQRIEADAESAKVGHDATSVPEDAHKEEDHVCADTLYPMEPLSNGPQESRHSQPLREWRSSLQATKPVIPPGKVCSDIKWTPPTRKTRFRLPRHKPQGSHTEDVDCSFSPLQLSRVTASVEEATTELAPTEQAAREDTATLRENILAYFANDEFNIGGRGYLEQEDNGEIGFAVQGSQGGQPTAPPAPVSSPAHSSQALYSPASSSRSSSALSRSRSRSHYQPAPGSGQEGSYDTDLPVTQPDVDVDLPGFPALRISSGKDDDLQCAAQLREEIAEEARREEQRRVEEEQRREAAERRRREEDEALARTGGLRLPKRPIISGLAPDWEGKVTSTLSARDTAELARTPEGQSILGRDFRQVVPATVWLNDEIINGTLAHLATFINRRAGIKDVKTQAAKCQLLNSYFWSHLTSRGPGSTDRWLRRLGIRRENFLDIDTLLIPINLGNSHWTLGVVRPRMGVIAHMDSMGLQGAGSPRIAATLLDWVKEFLKDGFEAEHWTVRDYISPRQTNGWDCGVHTITNGICVALGIDPSQYRPAEMPAQRLWVAGALLNSGFSGDFDLSSL